MNEEIEEDEKNNRAEDSGEGWLVSYADMMTLIACFFILMTAFANYDPVGFDKKAKEFSKAFNKGKFKSSEIKLTEISEEISRHPNLPKNTKITVNGSQLVITFSGTVLFQEGATEIDSEALGNLDTIIDIIRSKNENYKVVIEGHSDPYEYKKAKAAKDPWELAAIRSAKIASRFSYFGFDPKKLVASSKGDSSPALPVLNTKGKIDYENLKSNRRVVINVIKSLEKAQKLKFGLGIYFNE
jgi:chemotaxis protein MotB